MKIHQHLKHKQIKEQYQTLQEQTERNLLAHGKFFESNEESLERVNNSQKNSNIRKKYGASTTSSKGAKGKVAPQFNLQNLNFTNQKPQNRNQQNSNSKMFNLQGFAYPTNQSQTQSKIKKIQVQSNQFLQNSYVGDEDMSNPHNGAELHFRSIPSENYPACNNGYRMDSNNTNISSNDYSHSGDKISKVNSDKKQKILSNEIYCLDKEIQAISEVLNNKLHEINHDNPTVNNYTE